MFLSFLLLSVVYSGEFEEVKIDNISSTRILSIAQDSTGFIWIGTDDGLNRYDGFQNKVYRSNIFDETTVSGNRIWKIHVGARADNNAGMCLSQKATPPQTMRVWQMCI